MIQIHPAFDALYYSPYLLGLKQSGHLGSLRVSAQGIPNFGHHGLAIIFKRNGFEKKVFISASDGPGLNEAALQWADIYGKINIDDKSQPQNANGARLVAIGPSFPVRIWGRAAAAIIAARNFFGCRGRISGIRRHFSRYAAQYRYRLPEHMYAPSQSNPGYVFFASRLWRKEHETNQFRANFVRACRSSSRVQFEGGFVPRRARDVEGFKDLTVERSFSLSQYIDGIRESAVVFNTPAVAGCHGWKLAEYLALGKAVITTPLLRALPAPLENGLHVHVVDGSVESIGTAIEQICSDHRYRAHLETNARRYYDTYLRPKLVIRRLLESS